MATGELDRTPQRGSAQHGEVIVRADIAGTAVFIATAVFAAAVFTTAAQWVGAVTAMTLFALGVFAFLWGFWNAVQRSRQENVSVTQLFLLFGAATPPRVRWTMLGALAAQIITAFATTFWRIDGPDGSPGSSLAVGLLVPMFGIGLNGLWAAYHAEFEVREHDAGTLTNSIDQNEDHG